MNVISVHNLGIYFRLYQQQVRSIKTDVIDFLLRRYKFDHFWALRNINFKVKRGEMLGIIGRNGSGKSTMLKILAGIYLPDEGSFDIKGRLSALIELGAGFHPDLTGSENVMLNGAILGYSRDEIAAKYESIVSFSGVEKFMDSPIKNFSSGMQLRLGFSIAVHSEPDVLLIDEVLAVGDTQFKVKCYRKIEEFRKKGITIVFISHDMQEMNRYCDTVIWLDKGIIKASGNPREITSEYQRWLKKEKDNL